MFFDYLIIGSGIAGVSATETLRKGNKDCSIGLISNEPHDPYSKVLLPFWLKDKIQRNQLFIRGSNFWKKNNINFIFGEVTKLDCGAKRAALADGQEFFYGKLLIASGASAKRLILPGSDVVGVFYFRNLDEADAIKNYILDLKIRGEEIKPIIYGASFIALEFAGLFAHFGIRAKIMFRGPYFWSRVLDEQGGKLIEKCLGQAGMEICRNVAITEVRAGTKGRIKEIVTSKGNYECNFLGLGTGLESNLDFARAAGLKINHGVVVDEFLKTNDKNIYAVGDIAEFYDKIIGRHHVLGNWLNSDMQGRVATMNMLEQTKPFELVSFYSFTFDGFGGKGKFNICMIGDTNPEKPFESEIKLKNDQCLHVFSKKAKCIGAVIVNMSNLRSKAIEVIKNGLSPSHLDI